MSEPLQIFRCDRCGRLAWPPRLLCPDCGDDTWTAIDAGPGTVTGRTSTASPERESVVLATVELEAQPVVLVARAEDAPLGASVTVSVDEHGKLSAS